MNGNVNLNGNAYIEKKGYIRYANLITKEHAKLLSWAFIKSAAKDELGNNGDEQVPDSYIYYNYPLFQSLLFSLTPTISSAVKKRLMPTYAYARIYKHGNDLKIHRDRPSCEYSVTLHLGADKDWGIFMVDKETGEHTEINFMPGDGVIYKGCEVEHYRNAFEGTWYIQVFLHYIDANGVNSEFTFDKKDVMSEWNIPNPLQYIEEHRKQNMNK